MSAILKINIYSKISLAVLFAPQFIVFFTFSFYFWIENFTFYNFSFFFTFKDIQIEKCRISWIYELNHLKRKRMSFYIGKGVQTTLRLPGSWKNKLLHSYCVDIHDFISHFTKILSFKQQSLWSVQNKMKSKIYNLIWYSLNCSLSNFHSLPCECSCALFMQFR